MLSRYKVDNANNKALELLNTKNTRKKTTEQYVNELKEINSRIQVIGEYSGARNRIRVKCLTCKHIWEPQAGLLIGKKATGCPECGKKKIGDKLRKSHTDFIKEVTDKNPYIKILSKYISSQDYVDCLCLICKHTWSAIAGSIAKGHGCPKCAIKNRSQNQSKTHEQFVSQLDLFKGKKYILLNKYTNANTNIKCRCLICNNTWETLPNNLLGGSGCPYCKNRIKTHLMFVKQAKIKNPNIEILGKYNGSHNNVECRCLICNHIWNPDATSVLSGYGCPKCAGRCVLKEDFIKQFAITGYQDFEILGQYKNLTTKIKVYCKTCGHIIYIEPHRLLKGIGCKICKSKENGLKCKRSTIQYKYELKICHPNVEVLEEYIDARTPILHKFPCGHLNKVSPSSLLRCSGFGCKICGSKKSCPPKTTDKYKRELQLKNPNVELIGDYIGAKTKSEHKCKICGHVWLVTPSDILRGNGCPHCSSSKLERLVEHYLIINNICFDRGMKYCNLIGVGNGMLSYDFYLPQYNLLIECQGAQHERPIEYFGGVKTFVKQKIHDIRKRRYAHDNNIKLLEIWYYENSKIDKILKQTLNNLKSECRETVIPA